MEVQRVRFPFAKIRFVSRRCRFEIHTLPLSALPSPPAAREPSPPPLAPFPRPRLLGRRAAAVQILLLAAVVPGAKPTAVRVLPLTTVGEGAEPSVVCILPSPPSTWELSNHCVSPPPQCLLRGR
jgi:hypothetical protein